MQYQENVRNSDGDYCSKRTVPIISSPRNEDTIRGDVEVIGTDNGRTKASSSTTSFSLNPNPHPIPIIEYPTHHRQRTLPTTDT